MSGEQTQTRRVLTAIGAAYRGDWSDFDGRSLKAQLAKAAEIADLEVDGGATEAKRAADALLEDWICEDCMSWVDGYGCDCGACGRVSDVG